MDIDKGGQTICNLAWASGSNTSNNCSGAVYTWNLISGTGTVLSTRNGGADAYIEATGTVGSSVVYNRTTTLNGVNCTSQNVTVQVCSSGANPAGCPIFSIIQLSSQGCPKAFPGQPLQLGTTGLSVADYNFSWSPAALVDNPTASVVNIVSGTIDTIVLTITNKYDPTIVCTASLPINNPLWALPVASISNKNTCPGVGVQIGTTNVVGYAYTWTPSTNLDNAAISNPTATLNSTATYLLLVQETATGCQITDTTTVSVSSIGFDAGPNRAVCNNAIVTLGTTPTGSYSYAWSPSGAAWQNGTDQTFANPQVLFAGAPQAYSVIVS